MSVGSFSVKNPVLINILMISILVLGYQSVQRLPQEQFSDVPFFWVIISVPYPGASPFDIERSVAIPVENEMDGLRSVREVQTIIQEGIATIQIQFEEGISREEFVGLYSEAQTRFGRVELPDGALEPTLTDFSSEDFLPVIEAVLHGEVDSVTLVTEVRRLRDEITSLPEVSMVTLTGAPERQIRINAHQSALESYRLSIDEVVQSVSGADVRMPAGFLKTPRRQYLVRTVEEKTRPEDFGDIIVRQQTPEMGLVRLSDVADVREALSPTGPVARFNFEPATNLQISKITGASSVDVVDDIRQLVEEFKPGLEEGLRITFINDATVRIRSSINVLVTNAVFGFVLLILVLWYFVGIRNSFIIGLGIPITFAITFIVLEITGDTLNSNSLFALVLVLGLIVDHAIVIIENCYRVRQEGLSPEQAAIRGTDEVFSPVVSATLTTIAAFLPLMIVPGLIGRFLRVIPLVVTIALLASNFEALLLLPSHFAHWSSSKTKEEKRFFLKIESLWSRILRRVYHHRYVAIGIGFIFLLFSAVILNFVQQDLFAGEEYSYFFIEIEMPPGTPRHRTLSTVQEFETVLHPYLEDGTLRSVLSVIGQGGRGLGATTLDNLGQIIVELPEREEGRIVPVTEVMNRIEEKSRWIAGAENVRFRTIQEGPPVDDPVTLRFFSDSYEDLFDVAEEVTRYMEQQPDRLFNVKDNIEKGTPELFVSVNQENASRLGLNASYIGTYLNSIFDGVTATTIFDRNEDIDVIVVIDEDEINSAFRFNSINIPSPQGEMIPLSTVASIIDTTDIASIRRRNGRRFITVSAQIHGNVDLTQINQEIISYYNTEIAPRYPNVTLEPGGEFEEFQEIISDILRLFLVGIFLMYVIMGTLFKSYTQPLLLMFSIPFAFAGVVIFLFISGTPFSSTVMYAGVALAGIAVNDSIVLISFINKRDEEYENTMQAVLEAVRVRLRPIMLTSITTIGGLLPTALGVGGVSPVWGPMASTIIFGLLFSTLTTLMIIPCMYGIGSDIADKIATAKGKIKSRLKGGDKA
ncbi:Acriflavin resistance protein [Chitinispirillum alkaliphilum]|nr:Acriflavin resistance protein [Chitinispirillum alkaliphilum]